MPRIALLVGVNHYPAPIKDLPSSVRDAEVLKEVLEFDDDDSTNFHCEIMTSTPVDNLQGVTRQKLIDKLNHVFMFAEGIALFYFSGHGLKGAELESGYLATQDAKKAQPGLAMNEVMDMASNALKNNPRLYEIFIVLDCCHSGAIANENTENEAFVKLAEGVSILAAAESNQYAYGKNGHSHFTRFLIEGLRGAAADVIGHVNAAGLYNYVEKCFTAMQQRPIFRASLSRLSVLRKVNGKLTVRELKEGLGHFEATECCYLLKPEMEHTKPNSIPQEIKIFESLQKLYQAGLVEPVGSEKKHMYWAAIGRKGCQLTSTGKAYFRMVKARKI
ncbi:MAG TPA: hypothetical protein DCR93_06340 [Cytophagales bacterium]|nr:hypothetical protein [Cytophagales bacterium]HAP59129.1 hypothetical protein [Cytophagales bacterium]